MVSLSSIAQYCDELLACDSYSDYAPNGVQIEGRAEIRQIVSGVTASQALIDSAIGSHADLLLVHHGYFWKGESPPLTGLKGRRIKSLFCNDISLMAYHLPLDGHPELGNNAQLAKLWGFDVAGRFGDGPDSGLGCFTNLDRAMDISEIETMVSQSLGRSVMRLGEHTHPCQRIGWCSGAAQGYIEQAASLGIDTFISGEVSEQTTHLARELGIHYIAAGHHATERLGVQALGDHLADHFSISHRFVDITNPA